MITIREFNKPTQPREYMTVREFLNKFPIKRPMNYDRSPGRVPNALWFEFYDAEVQKKSWEQKEKFYNHLDVVFFDVTGVEELREKENIGLFGSVKIKLIDESLGQLKLSYKNDMAKGWLTFCSQKVGVKQIEIKNVYQDIPKKCDLCDKEMLVTEFGNGSCIHCGWSQSKWAVKNPDKQGEINLMSFNRAKELFDKGLPIKLTYEEFLNGLETILHMEFYYKGQLYGVLAGHGAGYELFKHKIKEGYQSYETLEEFRDNANIDDNLLKDIWEEIEKPGHMTH